MSQRLEMTRPYARALVEDEKAREHALGALAEARLLQRQFQGDGLREAVVRLIDDKATHAHLRHLTKELGAVNQRAKRPKRGRWLLVALAGGSIVLLVNPVTGPGLRRWFSSLLGHHDASVNGKGPKVERSIEDDIPVSTT